MGNDTKLNSYKLRETKKDRSLSEIIWEIIGDLDLREMPQYGHCSDISIHVHDIKTGNVSVEISDHLDSELPEA